MRLLLAASDGMELLSIFGLLALALFVLVGMYIWERSGSNKKLRGVARALKLRFGVTGSPLFKFGRVTGFYRGFQVEISVIGRGIGRRRQYFFVLQMLFPESLKLGLSLAEKGLLNKLGSLIGVSKTFAVGPAKFSKLFAVGGRKRAQIKELFDDEVQKQLIRAQRAKVPINYNDDGLQWEVTTMIDVGALRSAIEKSVPVMGAMWEALTGEPHAELEEAVAQARQQRKAKGAKPGGAKKRKRPASGKKAPAKASSKKRKKSGSAKAQAAKKSGAAKKATAKNVAEPSEKVSIPCACGAVLKVRAAKLGRKARCPSCQEVVLLEV